MTRRTAQQVSDALAATPVPTGNEPCRGALDIFYPPVGARPTTSVKLIDTARNICRECPTQPTCLTEAHARGEQFGVWGGVNFVFAKKHGGSGRESAPARRWRMTVEANEIRQWREQDAR